MFFFITFTIHGEVVFIYTGLEDSEICRTDGNVSLRKCSSVFHIWILRLKVQVGFSLGIKLTNTIIMYKIAGRFGITCL